MSYREVSEIRDGMRIDWDMPIKMDDGIVLRCDIYRPIKEGRYPVILTYGPYGKWLHFEDLYSEQWRAHVREHPDVPTGSTNKYQCWEVVDPEKWVPDGYVCIRVDSRGAGRSPGVIDIWSLREAQDLAQCVEWAGVQPWSNGKVGLNGISYYAENQWQCAALQPKHLAAICLWEGAADFYRDMAHHGGIFCTASPRTGRPRRSITLQHGRGTRGFKSRMTGDWVSGPDRADRGGARRQPAQFLRGLSRPQARHRRVLAVAHAGLVEGQGAAALDRQLGRPGPASARQFRGLRALRVEAEVARSATASSTGRISTRTTASRCRRSSSATSSRARRPAGTSSPRCSCRSATSTSSSSGTRSEWPLKRTKWTKFFLDPADFTLSTKRQAKKSSVTYKGLGDGVTFLTEPLKQDTEITGPIAAKLWVSSATEDADLFLVVRVFSPDMKEIVFQGALDPHTPIAQGWLRVSHRKLDKKLTLPYRPYHTHDEEQKLKPGEVVRGRRRGLADLHRGAGGLPHRAHGARQGLRVGRRLDRRTEDARHGVVRLRPVPARRSARPAGHGVRRQRHAARRAGAERLSAAAGHSGKEEVGVRRPLYVMPGLVPGIHALLCRQVVGGRDIGERSDAVLRTAVPGHDADKLSAIQVLRERLLCRHLLAGLRHAIRRHHSVDDPVEFVPVGFAIAVVTDDERRSGVELFVLQVAACELRTDHVPGQLEQLHARDAVGLWRLPERLELLLHLRIVHHRDIGRHLEHAAAAQVRNSSMNIE